MPDVIASAPAAAPAPAAPAPNTAPPGNGGSTRIDGGQPAPAAVPPAPAAAPAAKPSEPDAKAWASLAAKERAIEAQRQTHVKEKADLEARVKSYGELEKLLEEAKTNPEAILSRTGWDYAKLAEWKIKGAASVPADVKAAQAKADLDKRLADMEAKQKEVEARQEQIRIQENILGMKQQIKSYIAADPDKYELIGLHADAHDLVYARMEAIYVESKGTVNPDPVKVLDFMEKREERHLERATKAKKFAKYAPKPAAEAPKAPAAASADGVAPVAAAEPVPGESTRDRVLRTFGRETDNASVPVAEARRYQSREELIADTARQFKLM